MIELKYIVGAERDAYIDDLSGLVIATVKGVVDLADRYNLDRDNAMDHFATIFKTIQEISTFQHFGEGE